MWDVAEGQGEGEGEGGRWRSGLGGGAPGLGVWGRVGPAHGVVVEVGWEGAGLALPGAVVVLKAVVLVPGEHHAPGPGRGLRVGLWAGPHLTTSGGRQRQGGVAGGGGGRGGGAAEHVPQRVEREAAAHHVAHVAVPEPNGWKGRPDLVEGRAVTTPAPRGGDWGLGGLQVRGGLSVVQVGVRRGFRGLWGSLVWRENGHGPHL